MCMYFMIGGESGVMCVRHILPNKSPCSFRPWKLLLGKECTITRENMTRNSYFHSVSSHFCLLLVADREAATMSVTMQEGNK
jgi:hypothetical protein